MTRSTIGRRSSKTTPKLSLARIRAITKEIAFNPKVAGPMKIVAEQTSTEYFEARAMELISEAQMVRGSSNYKAIMVKALQVLTLAILNEEA